MIKVSVLFLIIFASTYIYSQTYTISFAAAGEANTVDSVKAENLTNPATTRWHEGDVLQLEVSNGICNLDVNGQNLKVYPNPMKEQSEISFYAKQTGNTTISIYDFAGKKVLQTEGKLMQGTQKYKLEGLNQGMYFVNISGDNYFYTAKLISDNTMPGEAKIKYLGNVKSEVAMSTLKSIKATVSLPCSPGDNLRFTGYAGSYSSIVNEIPTGSKTITFAFETPLLTTVQIPGGTFIMGSPATEVGHNDYGDETQYQVTLNAFRMSKYEITNIQFADFLNAKGIGSDGLYADGAYPDQILIYASDYYSDSDWGLHYTNDQWVAKAGYENHPAIYVTWFGAAEFATYIGGRLPTEAEWEYACRAMTTTPFNTGDCLSNTQANYDWLYPYTTCSNTGTLFPGTTQVIGSYAPNAYDLYDMHGNVWEWCNDWYSIYPSTPQTNPTGPAAGSFRVVRGGGWYRDALFCRSAFRLFYYPDSFGCNLGFRVILIQ